MNITAKQKWIDKLRSGIPQAQMALRRPNGSVCAMGALCEVAVDEGVIAPAVRSPLGTMYYGYCSIFAPDEVLEWADITSDVPQQITAMNDSGESFDTIAKYIEENL